MNLTVAFIHLPGNVNFQASPHAIPIYPHSPSVEILEVRDVGRGKLELKWRLFPNGWRPLCGTRRRIHADFGSTIIPKGRLHSVISLLISLIIESLDAGMHIMPASKGEMPGS
jgi:hypothetical protein